MKLRALACLGASLLFTVFAGVAQAANPLGIAYSSTTNVSLYAKPTGVLLAGRCNRYSSAFASARSKGAEVYAYINAFERPDNFICSMDEDLYMNNYGAVPLWPYPSYGQRYAWPGTKLTDMRPGSKWILYVVSYVEKLMRERKVDGVWLDGIGARPWGRAEWTTWSTTEKNLWTDGAVDLVRRLDAKRRAIIRTSSSSTTTCGTLVITRAALPARSTSTASPSSIRRRGCRPIIGLRPGKRTAISANAACS